MINRWLNPVVSIGRVTRCQYIPFSEKSFENNVYVPLLLQRREYINTIIINGIYVIWEALV